MNIDVRKPSIRVLLKKNVGRTTVAGGTPLSKRYAGASTVLDLTPYIGEQGAVRLTKSVRAPCGSFSIVLADRVDMEVQDSLYTVIEPMDSIEIYISGASALGPSGPPIMMRGFVSKVQRTEGMSAEGKPTRSVVVTGHDYGKILQIAQIFNMPFGQDVANTITSFPYFARFGFDSHSMTVVSFINTAFDKVVNPYLARMRENPDGTPPSTAPILPIKTDIQTNGERVSPFGAAGWNQGTMYGLITEFCDVGAWNEFFIEDREDGPYAVYRPNPFLYAGYDGLLTPGATQPSDPQAIVADAGLILPGAVVPAVTDIVRADVVSMTAARSDENVANYYWVDAPRYTIVHGDITRAVAFQAASYGGPETVYVTDYGNVSPALYGTRKMEERTQMLDSTEQYNGANLNGPAVRQSSLGQMALITQRRKQLIAQNRDNVVFETGSMRVKGNESIKAGTYVRLSGGGMKSLYYVVSVTHDFTAFGNYFTSVEFERGTGFIDRAVRSAQQSSPYWGEMTWKNNGD